MLLLAGPAAGDPLLGVAPARHRPACAALLVQPLLGRKAGATFRLAPLLLRPALPRGLRLHALRYILQGVSGLVVAGLYRDITQRNDADQGSVFHYRQAPNLFLRHQPQGLFDVGIGFDGFQVFADDLVGGDFRSVFAVGNAAD
jgi:hypothetical protein